MQAAASDVAGTGTQEVEDIGKNFKATDDMMMDVEVRTVRGGGRTFQDFDLFFTASKP